jgi:hypothetical protein
MKIGRKKEPVERDWIERSDAGDDGAAHEQRLQTLIQLEREARDLFERREAEQAAGWRAGAEARLAAAEAALEDLRSSERRRQESERALLDMEQNLVEAWQQVALVREELADAKREADQARKEIKPRSARQVEEARTELGEARAKSEDERRVREELEGRLEAAEQSEREAREMLGRGMSPSEAEAAERRIAELEETLAGVQDEIERERQQRIEMERRLEALVQQEVQADRTRDILLEESETKRLEAERAAEEGRQALARERELRELERKRISAIDEELRALVARDQSARPSLEEVESSEGPTAEPGTPSQKKNPVQGESGGEGEGHEHEQFTQSAPSLLEALAPGQSRDAQKPEPAPQTPEGPDEAPEPGETMQDPSPAGRGRLLGRGRRRQNQSKTCSVCQRTQKERSAKQLTAAGWAIVGERALCSDCRHFGWQLPDDGGLPFRRSSAGQTSS